MRDQSYKAASIEIYVSIVVNVWAFSKVYYTLEILPTKLLNKRLLSITHPMTQAFLEDAHKKRPQSIFATIESCLVAEQKEMLLCDSDSQL